MRGPRAAILRSPHTAMKSGPHLPQLEKALTQKQRPNTAINKFKKKKKKQRTEDLGATRAWGSQCGVAGVSVYCPA